MELNAQTRGAVKLNTCLCVSDKTFAEHWTDYKSNFVYFLQIPLWFDRFGRESWTSLAILFVDINKTKTMAENAILLHQMMCSIAHHTHTQYWKGYSNYLQWHLCFQLVWCVYYMAMSLKWHTVNRLRSHLASNHLNMDIYNNRRVCKPHQIDTGAWFSTLSAVEHDFRLTHTLTLAKLNSHTSSCFSSSKA